MRCSFTLTVCTHCSVQVLLLGVQCHMAQGPEPRNCNAKIIVQPLNHFQLQTPPISEQRLKGLTFHDTIQSSLASLSTLGVQPDAVKRQILDLSACLA
jgi:hypothetical protein